MTTPSQAADALRRAVDNQRAQREAASEAVRPVPIDSEQGIERPETDTLQ